VTPLEHYRRAEELLVLAAGSTDADHEIPVVLEGEDRYRSPLELLAMASVHARLAGVGTVVSATEPGPTGRPAWMGRPL
jgi:hypothetical protein